MRNWKIAEGIDDERLEDALRISYDAFAAKFRIGFRNADDLIRLFRDSIDKTSCLSAIVDGRLAGVLDIPDGEPRVLPPEYVGGLHEVLAA